MLLPPRAHQDKLNKEAIVGRVIGTVLGKREGENVVDVTTTVDMLPVFWEAEKVKDDPSRGGAFSGRLHRTSNGNITDLNLLTWI